jgi:hypothetical protein
MFSTALTTGTGFPGSRVPITRDPVLDLRSRPPWRTGVGSLRSSFEAFTLFPCYGGFGFTPNPPQPVRSNGPDRIVRYVLVRATGYWCMLPSNINLSPIAGISAWRVRPTRRRRAASSMVRKEAAGAGAMHGRSDSAAGPVVGARTTAWYWYTNVLLQFSNAGTTGYRPSAGGSPSSFSTSPSSSTVTTPRLFTA